MLHFLRLIHNHPPTSGRRVFGRASVVAVVVASVMTLFSVTANAQPTLQVLPRTYRVSQPNMDPVEIPAVETLSSAEDFYSYSSASSHTGFEQSGRSLLFLHRDIREGKDDISLIVTHGIDEDSSGQTQPDALVELTISGVPSGADIQVSDDPGEYNKSGGTVTGSWSFRKNTDGGSMGPFPIDEDWEMTFDIDLVWGISEWQYYFAGGNNLTLDANEPLTISYRAPPTNSSWETRTIAGTELTLCAGLESSSGNPLDYTFTWNDTPIETDSDTTSSSTEVVCSAHTFNAAGLYTLTLEADDGSGSATADISIYVEDPTPMTATITSPSDGSVTPNTDVPVTATTDPDAEVELSVNGTHRATKNADQNGDVSFSATEVGSLSHGEHGIELLVSDVDGNSGMTRNDFNVDTISEATLSYPDFSPYLTHDSTPDFYGEWEEGSTGVLTITDSNGFQVDTSSLSVDFLDPARWSAHPFELPDGTYGFEIVVTDPVGNEKSFSGNLTVDTVSEVAVTKPSSSVTVTSTLPYEVTGTSEPGAEVKVHISGGNLVPSVVGTAEQSSGDWSNWLAGFQDGTYTLSAESTDPAGNTAETAEIQLVIDTTPPSVALTSPKGDDAISASAPTFSGTAEMGADVMVEIFDSNQNPVAQEQPDVDSPGEWTFSQSLPDGEYTVKATATDAASNTSTTSEVSFTIDTVAPVLAITAPTADAQLPTASPAISGTVESGVALHAELNNSQAQTMTTGTPQESDGDWNVPLPQSLPDDTYTLEMTATDAAGNETKSSLSFTVDTTAPAISLTSPSDGSISATSQTTFGGTAEAGTDVVVTILDEDGAPTFTGPATTDGSGNWTLERTMTDGTYTVHASATDAATNEEQSNSHGFTVDTVSPEVAIESPNPGDVIGTGSPDIHGSSEPGTSVRVTLIDNSGKVAFAGQPNDDGNGDWSLPALSLSDGSYSVSAVADDEAGNAGYASSVPFTVDTSGPSVSLDQPTNGQQMTSLMLSGATEPGSTISFEVLDDAGNVIRTGSAAVNSAGEFSATAPGLAEGSYTLVVTATDAAGNEATSAPRDFVIDQSAPSVAISIPAEDAQLSDDTPTFEGTADAGSTVSLEIRDANDVIAFSGQATGDANWSVQTTSLDAGAYVARATAVDGAGNATTSAPRNFAIDTDGPSLTLKTPQDGAATNDSTPEYHGRTEPNSTVTLQVYDADGNLVFEATTTASESGSWGINGEPLEDGDYTLHITSTDSAGNEMTLSPAPKLEINTSAPSIAITIPSDGTMATTSTPEIAGTTDPGASVRVDVYDTADALAFSGDATVESSGTWSLQTSTLDDGEYVVTASAHDDANNESTTQPRSFSVSTEPPMLVVDNPVDELATADGMLAIDGHTEPDATMVIEILDAADAIVATPEVMVEADGSFSATVADALDEGTYRLEFTAIAVNGTSSEESRTVAVDMTAPAVELTSPADGEVVATQTPTIRGTAESGADVMLFIDDELVAEFMSMGEWTFQLEDALAEGEHTILVSAIDEAGNEGAADEATFTIDLDADVSGDGSMDGSDGLDDETSDGSGAGPDADDPTDGESDGAGDGSFEETTPGSGCGGCSQGAGNASAPAWLLLAGLLMAARRRRREA